MRSGGEIQRWREATSSLQLPPEVGRRCVWQPREEEVEEEEEEEA